MLIGGELVEAASGKRFENINPATEKILGCRLVGTEAGELVHVFVALIQAGATARAIVDAEMAHPTFSEGLQSLVMTLPRFSLR